MIVRYSLRVSIVNRMSPSSRPRKLNRCHCRCVVSNGEGHSFGRAPSAVSASVNVQKRPRPREGRNPAGIVLEGALLPAVVTLPVSGIAAAPAPFEARWILIFAQPGVKGDRVIIPRMGIRFAILSIFGQMHLAYISAWPVFRRKLPVSHF